ncbi:hypothetical protein CJU89_1043 [Yarrowia sp. B02]|nr:hypothetical protein CJU89_1043 [Yarrowia sp. B02]
MRLKFHHLIFTAGAVLSLLLFLSLCPLTLKRIPSNYINTAVDGYYFQYHRLTHVRHRKNWFRPSVRGIIDGSFFEVDSTAPWRVAFSSNKPGVAPAAVTQPAQRPTIVTLHAGSDDSGIIAAWKRAWYAAGFNPVVERETDHSLQHKMEAVSRANALIYCDQHVLPIDFRPNLPGGRMKEELSESREKHGHRGQRWRPNEYMPDLYDDNDVIDKLKNIPAKTTIYSQIEGSLHMGLVHFESSEFLRDMVQKLSSQRVTATEASRDFRVSMENTRALGVYTPANLETVTGYSSLQEGTVAGMISAHKRNMFSAVFSNGLQVVDPYEGMSQIFSLPSLRLAQRLGACPSVPLANTCPPTAPVLEYFKQHSLTEKTDDREGESELKAPKLSDEHLRELQKLGCMICQDQSQIRLLRAYNLRPRTFKIGTLAHPLTRVAAEHTSTDVNIEMVYDSSTAYESWVHNVTHRVISSDRFGSVPKVLMMKDVLYKSFFEQSNSMWLAWEDTFVPSAQSNDDMEYHLGFVLPPEPEARVHVKSFKSIGEGLVSPHEFFDNGEIIMKAINARLHNDDGNDSILNTVEGWNIPDTEIWRFLQELKSLHRSNQGN